MSGFARAVALAAIAATGALAASAAAEDSTRQDHHGMARHAAGEVVREHGPAARAAAGGMPVLALPPLVRLAGHPTARGARIRLLEVFAPPQATVTVRCRGRTCPYHLRSKRPPPIRITFRGFRGRRLRAGTLVEVFITAPGAIGKYTAFLIRRRQRPARVDFCLLPSPLAPTACPRAG